MPVPQRRCRRNRTVVGSSCGATLIILNKPKAQDAQAFLLTRLRSPSLRNLLFLAGRNWHLAARLQAEARERCRAFVAGWQLRGSLTPPRWLPEHPPTPDHPATAASPSSATSAAATTAATAAAVLAVSPAPGAAPFTGQTTASSTRIHLAQPTGGSSFSVQPVIGRLLGPVVVRRWREAARGEVVSGQVLSYKLILIAPMSVARVGQRSEQEGSEGGKQQQQHQPWQQRLQQYGQYGRAGAGSHGSGEVRLKAQGQAGKQEVTDVCALTFDWLCRQLQQQRTVSLPAGGAADGNRVAEDVGWGAEGPEGSERDASRDVCVLSDFAVEVSERVDGAQRTGASGVQKSDGGGGEGRGDRGAPGVAVCITIAAIKGDGDDREEPSTARTHSLGDEWSAVAGAVGVIIVADPDHPVDRQQEYYASALDRITGSSGRETRASPFPPSSPPPVLVLVPPPIPPPSLLSLSIPIPSPPPSVDCSALLASYPGPVHIQPLPSSVALLTEPPPPTEGPISFPLPLLPLSPPAPPPPLGKGRRGQARARAARGVPALADVQCKKKVPCSCLCQHREQPADVSHERAEAYPWWLRVSELGRAQGPAHTLQDHVSGWSCCLARAAWWIVRFTRGASS